MKPKEERMPILLVEDDPDDIEITRRAFQENHINHPLYIVRDGAETIEFLKKTGRYMSDGNLPRPGLILLDLNIPRIDGREVLRQIKQDPELKYIPTVVLTTSKFDEDIMQSYHSGANTFITKSLHFKEFSKMIRIISQYWLEVAEIPGNPDHKK
ncbi:MAG: response regulator [Candidatus Zhuqueibacterota bacterium]